MTVRQRLAGLSERMQNGVRQTALPAVLLGSFLAGPAMAATGERTQITGEVMDTWCYFSGVMGGQEAVVGSSHHTCAMWCAAGGIPVGVLADDGTVYMVLKLEGKTTADGDPALLSIQSDRITADGFVYERDGFKYLVVEKVVSNEGITNLNHNDFGFIPPFAVPEGDR